MCDRSIDSEGYKTLSESLASNLLLKKKNLKQRDGPFRFRVRSALSQGDWISHEVPFNVLSNEEEALLQMSMPIVNPDDATCSVHIKWDEFNLTPEFCKFLNSQKDLLKIHGYEIQLRICSMGGSPSIRMKCTARKLLFRDFITRW